MSITVIILTKNEERHIIRAISSVSHVADRCYVIDSGSSDRTTELAQDAGAIVLVHPFVNQAQQFNWALNQLPEDTDWVLRLDADEFVTKLLASELQQKLASLSPEIHGVYFYRSMIFLGRLIKWGGIYPIRILRLFRFKKGYCENRWMDEHIVVHGDTVDFRGEIIDDNLNSLSWWTEKHNLYASREVVDILNREHHFMSYDSIANLWGGNQSQFKRWVKENLYNRLPIGLRPFIYFIYRFLFRLGFLDGVEGVAFHILQGFWYRYLVDMKLREVRIYMKSNNVHVERAIYEVLGINVMPPNTGFV